MCMFSECLAVAFEFHAVKVRPLLFACEQHAYQFVFSLTDFLLITPPVVLCI